MKKLAKYPLLLVVGMTGFAHADGGPAVDGCFALQGPVVGRSVRIRQLDGDRADIGFFAGEVTADTNAVIRFRGPRGEYRLSWLDTNGLERVQFVTLAERKERFFAPADPMPRPGAVAVFRKTLALPLRKIVRAELKVAPLGVFDASVNGKTVAAEEFMKGGYTHFIRERHRFDYDVVPYLHVGVTNEIYMSVAGSWWCDKVATRCGSPGKTPAVAGELVCQYEDGSSASFPIDESWEGGWSERYTFATVYGGEDYDAGATEPVWSAVRISKEFPGNIVPRRGGVSALREDLSMRPKDVVLPFVLKAGEERVFDFGQNHAGIPEFRWQAPGGTKIVVRTAEMLNDSGDEKRGNDGPVGTLYRKNLRSARSEMRYRFGGAAPATYKPTFSFFGYRYLSLKADADVKIFGLRSLPVTDVAAKDERGRIVTGNDRLNRFILNCLWGLRSNFLSVPMDCPQRDERIGWGGDAQVFAPAALYMADVGPLLSKYSRDLALSQMSKGAYPPIAPYWNFEDGELDHFGASEGYADAGILIPYYVWLFQGDRKTPAECWNAMERYMELLARCKGHDWHKYGDWLSFDSNEDWVRNYISVAYWLYDAKAMKEMAADLDKPDRAAHFAKIEAEARDTLRRLPRGDVPSCAAHAVLAGLTVPKDEIMPKTGRLTTGFLGTACLLDALVAMGGVKEAYDLLLQREYPGWLYSVDQGATTVWERWNSYTEKDGFGDYRMNSFNHYANGSVLGWIYRCSAGIVPDPKHPGFEHFSLAPHPDSRLVHLDASVRSVHGVIRSSWRYEGGNCRYSFAVPSGTSASLVLPDGRRAELTPGEYDF